MRRALARLTLQQWVVRSVVVAGPLVVLLAGVAAGAYLPGWLLVVVLLTAAAGAARPRSHALTVCLVLVVAWWWVARPADGLWVLLAAVGTVAAHVAGVLAAYGPARLDIDAALLRTWGRRGSLLVGIAALAWVAVRVERPEPVVLTVGLVLVAVLTWWCFVRLAERP